MLRSTPSPPLAEIEFPSVGFPGGGGCYGADRSNAAQRVLIRALVTSMPLPPLPMARALRYVRAYEVVDKHICESNSIRK